MPEVVKIFGTPILFGLALALGFDIAAGPALASATPATPTAWLFVLRVMDSGICYFLLPTGSLVATIIAMSKR